MQPMHKPMVQHRRLAIVGIALLAAIATPPDPFSMLGAMAVMIAIYELAILALLR